MDRVGRIYVFALIAVGVSARRNIDQNTNIGTNTTPASSPLRICPMQYIDVLAQCPEQLACADDGDCSAVHVCCHNACGTKTCVIPWYPKEAESDNTVCNNRTCVGQGKQCKILDGETRCECVDECEIPTNNREMVCADNGMTYFSTCFMDVSACQSRIRITPSECNTVHAPHAERETRLPRFESVPNIKIAKESSTVTFICDASGHPRPSVFWETKNNGELLAIGATSGRLSVSSPNGHFQIRNVQLSDSGEYKCYAANPGGIASMKYRLQVRELKGNIQRRGGRSFKVDCGTFPSEQAKRCAPEERQRRIKRLWVYNKNKKICTKSYFRDCRAVTNKFPSLSECANACMDVCKFPPRKGSCKRFIQRIFYDSETGQCLPFVYSGCDGNRNNFPDVFACRARCPSRPASDRNNQTVRPEEPTIKLPTCPPCYMQEVRSVCQSEFVIIGMIKHFRSHRTNMRDGGSPSSSIHFQLSEVMHDHSESLNLALLNLENNEASKIDIELDLDEDCPCPDIEKLMGKAIENNSRISRRQLNGRESDAKVIIVGTTVNGIPTLNSNSYAAKYNAERFGRISSALQMPSVCQMMRMVDSQFG